MYCPECKTTEIVMGCPFCLKSKVKDMQEALEYYKREINLMIEEVQNERK